MKQKPIIIGMLPSATTNIQMWRLLHYRTCVTEIQYHNSFDRRTLVRNGEYDRLAARARAFEMFHELRDSRRTVVLLGQDVREAFHFVLSDYGNKFILGDQHGLPPVLIHPQEAGGCTWRQIPHPSCTAFYNEEKSRKLVELLMEELYNEYQNT